MKHKKVIIFTMVCATISLVGTSAGIILDNTKILAASNNSQNVMVVANSNEFENTSNSTNTEDDTTENVVQNNVESEEEIKAQQNVAQKVDTQNIQEARAAASSGNKIIEQISSREEVERINKNPIYVDVDSTNIVENTSEDGYEEIKTYTKLEDVKISFDMDVSQPTGLSKADFVELVKNMKYDRTGILEKNAEYIWEYCQKYSVNEIFVLGICGIESGWCSASQHQSTHNYSSLMKGGKLIAYASDKDGFETMIKLLGQKYLSSKGSLYHGKTITAVGRSYCNATTWPKKVYKCMNQVFE